MVVARVDESQASTRPPIASKLRWRLTSGIFHTVGGEVSGKRETQDSQEEPRRNNLFEAATTSQI